MSRRILLVAPDFLPRAGGVTRYLDALCRALSGQVVVVAPHAAGAEEADGLLPYAVHRYRKWPRLNAVGAVLTTLWGGLQARPSVCLFSGYYSSHYAAGFWLMRVVCRIPYAVITYGLDMSLREPALVEVIKRFLLSEADAVVTISEASRQAALGLGVRASRVRLLLPCVDTDAFKPVDSSILRERLGLDGKRVILTVSRLVPRKGHEVVLRSLALLRDHLSDLVYFIVGEGPCGQSLLEMAEALNVRDCVVFTGFVPDDDLPHYYSLCDVFVLPTCEPVPGHFEGFGIVYLEANACGKPVIASRSGGTADAVIDGETGLLVDPQDVDAVAEAILCLLTDRELARRLGENGRRRVEQEFSWEKVGERLESVLMRIACPADAP